MRRICVIGCGGSGKSTLSNKLEDILGIPVTHLDTLFYEQGWVEVQQKEFDNRLSKVLDKDKWIIDGNFNRTMDKRFQKADTIIFLDYSRFQSLLGVFTRLIRDYGKVRKDMAEGCPESFDWEFLKYVYSFNKVMKPQILEKLKQVDRTCEIITLSSRKDTQKWLNAL